MFSGTRSVKVGGTEIGPGAPCFIIAEAGINHNGDVELAERLIDVAVDAGCDAVKFQKRTPEISTPQAQKDLLRETPWGLITYLDYKKRIEFDSQTYARLSSYAKAKGIMWFASPWDLPSVDFLVEHKVPAIKLASATITDIPLLKAVANTRLPVIMSTGMSNMSEIERAVETLGKDELVLMHSTSSYPMAPEEANLKMIATLRSHFDVPVGYSGHEKGLQISVAAAALGANALERHVTIDRSLWGTDHSASLEPDGLKKLIRDVRVVESAMGDGIKRVYPSEETAKTKLRRV